MKIIETVFSIIGFIFRNPEKAIIPIIAFVFGVPMTYSAYAMIVGKTAMQGVVCRNNVLHELSNDDPYKVIAYIEQSGQSYAKCLSEVDPKKSSLKVMSDVRHSLDRK